MELLPSERTVALVLAVLAVVGAGLGDLEPVNEPLALKFIDQSCEATNISGFYAKVRNANRAARMYPPWNPPGADITERPGNEDFWNNDKSRMFLQSYDGHISDFFVNRISPVYYKWCVYLYSLDEDVYGCVNDNGTWGSPTFEQLGLLDKLSVVTSPPFPPALKVLEMQAISLKSYVNGNDLWHNAMIVYHADWNTSKLEPISYFVYINTEKSRIQYIKEFPTQENAFLVVGEPKMFTCITFGTFRSTAAGWTIGENVSNTVQFTTMECMDTANRISDCRNISVNEGFFGAVNCAQYSPIFRNFGTTSYDLVFWNPTMKNTGIFSCFVQDLSEQRSGYNEVLHVYVVFKEVPPKGSFLLKNSKASVKFVVKAPKNSTLVLLKNLERLENVQGGVEGSDCDDVPVVHQSSTDIDDFYSLYTAEIKICNVSERSAGAYECQVIYAVEAKEHVAKYSRTLTVPADKILETPSPRRAEIPQTSILPIALGAAGGGLVVTLLVLGLVVFSCLFSRRINNRTTHLKTPVPLTITINTGKNKTFISTPDEGSSVPVEFLRDNIVFHEQIGKGRFGKVMRASAHFIVPDMPAVNMVAVKTANSKTSHSRKMMLAELDVMKQLEAHANICNLLAFCTLDDPVLIIMEYACHGNLKQHLSLCSQAVQQSKNSLIAEDNDGYLNLYGNSATKAHIPGPITDSLLREFAYQIASGLEHLRTMNVIHRDLAARNILISEGFVLKIGDFGMATVVSEGDKYHKIVDDTEIIAVKWAALETLENKGYYFKSDVWSLAVVIWEIASYGDEPFKKVSVGLNLDKFIDHLQIGHRLAQPPGLSDEIYQKLLQCWCKSVDDRPSATDLKHFFEK